MKTEHRRGIPNTRYRVTDPAGAIIRLAADEAGVVAISTEEERAAADALRLPVTTVPKLSAKEIKAAKEDSDGR